MSLPLHILDCTIRDGSYVVDYQFTVEDTYLVAAGLAGAGVRHIEVGHGLGLNAQNCGKGNAAVSDVAYIRAARGAAPRALIGSFFIPGIGTEDSLRAAADAGLGFVRVGIDVDDHTKLEPFVRLARSLGLEVWGNLMKSYLVSPRLFGEICRQVAEFGTDIVALVDSAGGMKPDEVAAYASEAAGQTQTPLAFHGHNNLSLAVANCLSFVQNGGSYVDGTLSGMGRSGGNAATELLAVLLNDRLAAPVDWKRLTEFADAMMEFCVPDHARPRAVEIATGVNFFHSSFREKVVVPAATAANASLFRTILNLPQASRKCVTPPVAAEAAREAAREKKGQLNLENLRPDVQPFERLEPSTLEELAERLRVQKGKSLRRRIVTVAKRPEEGLRIGQLRRGSASLVAHLEIGDAVTLEKARTALAAACDLWLVDTRFGLSPEPQAPVPQFVYDDRKVIVQAVADVIQMFGLTSRSVGLAGAEAVAELAEVASGADDGELEALVLWSREAVMDESLNRVRAGGIVLIVNAGALSAAALDFSRSRKLRLWRVDCGVALIAEAERVAATFERFTAASGALQLADGPQIVAAGVIGNAGDVVVDSTARPRFILGVADGEGGLRPLTSADAERSHRVQQWMVGQWGL